MSAQFNPDSFCGQAPLLPLPDLILFPGMSLPLHIFEPRYVTLTHAALESDGLIVIGLLQPGWKKEPRGTPAVHAIAGMGRIMRSEELSDERYNIILQGVARVRILREPQSEPYRVADAKILQERLPDDQESARQRRGELIRLHRSLLPEDEQVRKNVARLYRSAPTLGALCDLLACSSGLRLDQRQQLLEETDVLERSEYLLQLLNTAQHFARLSSRLRQRPPPAPSLN